MNSSISTKLPGFQWAVDSTSLGEAKLCPRRYQLGILEGWTPRERSPHLTFGILLHQARERYEKARLVSPLASHDELLDGVLDWALRETWDSRLHRGWVSDHPLKNRLTLIQTIIWYLDEQAQNDSLETLTLANGKPAVELSFRFDSGFEIAGERIVFCGHLDRIALLNSTSYICDIKTSSSELSPRWLSQFTPGNQFSLYTIAGQTAFAIPVRGVIVDGVQVGVGFARFARHPIPRTEAQLNEWLDDAHYWIGQMQSWATAQYWPQNDKVCDLYGGCPFRKICAMSPSSRERWLEAEYVRRVWDPLQSREE